MKKTLLFLISSLLYAGTLPAQWTQVSGLYGEPVGSVRATSNRLFAMTGNGVYRSDNNGASWTNIPQLFLANVVMGLRSSGDTVTVYADPENYVSIDNGNTWIELPSPNTPSFCSDVASGGGMIYYGTWGDYLYVTNNSGTSWTQTTQGLTTSEINTISTEGTTVYVGTDDGVFKSTDSGNSFTFSGLTGEYVNKVYVKSPNVFAYTNTGIYKSGDNGATWGPFHPLISYADILDFAVSGNRVFAATAGELISTNTSIANWQPNAALASEAAYSFAACTQGTTVHVATNRGIFESQNNGTSWTEKNTGIIPASITALTVTDTDTLYAGASIYGVSHFDGNQWKFSGLPMLNSNSLLSMGNDVYSTGDFGINRTSDGGVTWDFINNTGGNPVIAFCADVAVSGNLIAGAALQDGILRSDDNGATWALISNGLQNSSVGCITFCGTNLIAGTYSNGLFTSTDGGLTWTQTGGAGEIINDVVAVGNNVYAASMALGGNYLSTDQGLTWNFSGSSYYSKLSASDSLIVGSGFGYIEVSRDSGVSFGYNTPAPAGTFIISNHVTNADVYAGTSYDGVWKITISEVTGIEGTHLQSASHAAVHPNIFSDESTLFVDEAVLTLQPLFEVMDLSGKMVRSEPVRQARMRISADGLSKGLYFYRVVTSNGMSSTGKMVIH